MNIQERDTFSTGDMDHGRVSTQKNVRAMIPVLSEQKWSRYSEHEIAGRGELVAIKLCSKCFGEAYFLAGGCVFIKPRVCSSA
jgi:hypothetical protein